MIAAMVILASLGKAQNAKIVEIENIVLSATGPSGEWTPAVKDQRLAVRDRIRTRQRSRAAVRLTDLYTLRLDQFTTIELIPAFVGDGKPRLDLLRGAGFIFSREAGGEITIRTPAANAALRGTQFHVQVGADGRSSFQVLEGTVEMTNPQGQLVLEAGESGEAWPGRAPQRTAVLEARNLLQWALYYPGVIDPLELDWSPLERHTVAASLAAYQSGDLLEALVRYPDHEPEGQGARLFKAGVLLAVGRLDESNDLLASTHSDHPVRRALERMIAAVQFREQPEWPPESLTTASEAIAQSYYQQSRSRLEEAREAARRATELAPHNGFAWTRLAELEFSFGRTTAAKSHLERSLTLASRNAQSHALRGFILSAENRIGPAREAFEEAIRIDGALGNAWLGLGLTKTRRGDTAGGRADLQTAAIMQPTTSIFHSYLGKALSVEGRHAEARRDIDFARHLDPNDPTPPLYSALERQQENQPNAAIADIQESIRLNDNRRVFRSSLLLDEDRAVRSANLARIYQNAGMTEVAVREATRAVEADYTNASAHLFLANAFDALRDPRRISLRYETPWFNELLLANLLAPVGGGPLSQFVSQQEYSKLLAADGVGGSVTHQWRYNRDADADDNRSSLSAFGNYGNFSFGLDASFFEDTGERFNAHARRKEVYGQFKWQATRYDSLYFLGKWQDQTSGDNFETYDNQPLSPGFNFRERQEPGLMLIGWNHRWAPGSNTLALGGRLSAHQWLSDPFSSQLLVRRDAVAFRPGLIGTDMLGLDQFADPALARADPPAAAIGEDFETVVYSPALRRALLPYIGSGEVLGAGSAPFAFETWREFEIYTGEVQHIWQTEANTLLFGGRAQAGEFETETRLSVIRPNFDGGFTTPAAEQRAVVDFERVGLYAYNYWQPTRLLTLLGGVAWDRIEHPENFRNPPVSDDFLEEERVSAKAGFTLSPFPWISLRGAYTESLGGVSFDESVRLEPVQVSGFNQAYRTILSESIAGSIETPVITTRGLGLEGRLPTQTWWGVSGNIIEQDVDRTIGAFSGYDLTLLPITPAYFPDGTEQRLSYREESLSASLNQLIGREFSIGADYRVTRSQLRTTFTEFPPDLVPGADLDDEAKLHELSIHADWNSPSGLFARVEANWFSQTLKDDPRRLGEGSLARPGDDFWQFNAFVGYRFRRNLCEISAGVLNMGGTDYNLSPLNPYQEIERYRTVVLQCRLSF